MASSTEPQGPTGALPCLRMLPKRLSLGPAEGLLGRRYAVNDAMIIVLFGGASSWHRPCQ